MIRDNGKRKRKKRRRRQSLPVAETACIASRSSRRALDHYASTMFPFCIYRLFALVMIFATSFCEAESSEFSRITGGANKSENSTEGQYSVEYSDYMEVPGFRKHGSGHFDYYNFAPGIEVETSNATASTLVINKCCRWNYFFDPDKFMCTPLPRNFTASDYYLGGITSRRNESNVLFRESFPDCGNRSVLSVRLLSRVAIGATGVVVAGEGVHPKYCVDGDPGRSPEFVVLVCYNPALLCATRSCFRKCCSLGYSYGLSGRKCQKSNRSFEPKFYDLSTLSHVDSAKTREYGVYLGDACGARGKYLLEREAGEISYLGLDGSLFVPSLQKRTFSESEFCVEFIETGNSSRVESFLCFSKSGTHFENSQLQFFLLSLGFIISSMFLLVTFLVYLFSPKSRNLYGKTLMCYIACLFVAYLCLAVVELKSKDINKAVCTSLGYSLLFSFLAAFFWLNVMSFDIWKTFRLDRSVDRSKTDKGKLQFIWYSLYAWSFPSVITAACAYVNQIQDFPYEAFKPDIGEENCWFSKKKKGIYLFFITPISLVITFNVIFYVQTAWKIWKVKSDVKKMDSQKTKKFSANKEQFIINGKLFIVMGITWSLEIISFFAPHPIWYLTDAANALHGVFIFAVFVLKRKVLHCVSQQVRAPLKKMRQLTTSDSEDLSRRKNFSDLNTEGKTCATGAVARNEDSKKNLPSN